MRETFTLRKSLRQIFSREFFSLRWGDHKCSLRSAWAGLCETVFTPSVTMSSVIITFWSKPPSSEDSRNILMIYGDFWWDLFTLLCDPALQIVRFTPVPRKLFLHEPLEHRIRQLAPFRTGGGLGWFFSGFHILFHFSHASRGNFT